VTTDLQSIYNTYYFITPNSHLFRTEQSITGLLQKLIFKAYIVSSTFNRNIPEINSCIRPIMGRPRRRWVDNIKMDLQEVVRGRGDWMELAPDRDRWRALVGTVRYFRVP
jgi:hypothetical protein